MARIPNRKEWLIPSPNRYSVIIEAIFQDKYEHGNRVVDFAREDIAIYADKLNVKVPKNLGDVIYSFRYRSDLPASIVAEAPEDETWIIRSAGQSKYRFVLVTDVPLIPNPNHSVTKIPDATPGIISKYAFNDEQALLARIRYNRLIDIFLGITTYSLQNHLRTTVKGIGQVESDEIYVGIDRNGCHYVVPVQAKGGNDRLSRIQIEQDISLCNDKLPSLICRPIGAQFDRDSRIVLFEFVQDGDDILVDLEKHYKLVPPGSLSSEELVRYRNQRSLY